MKSLNLFFSTIILISTCNQVSAADLVNLEDFPGWFQDAMVREIKVRKKSKLKLKKFNINEKVKGKFKLIGSSDGYWSYHVNIGTKTPIECYVFTKYDGAANSLHSIVQSDLASIAERNKKTLTSKFNYAVGTGIIGNTPYLAMDTLYSLGEGESKVSSFLKGLSAETNESLQICTHDEIGYRNAFFTVFKSFIKAFIKNEESSEYFESVFQMTLNGMPIGYGREKYSVDEDGDIAIKTESSMLVPVDATSFSRSDAVSSSWSRKDGSLINSAKYTVENGALSSSYTIQMQGGKWQVEGELQGKPIKTELAHTEPLISEYGSYLKTKDLIKSESMSSEFYMWVAEADPTSTIEVKLSKVSGKSEKDLIFNMGPLIMSLETQSSGVLKQGSIEQGSVTIDIVSRYVKGEPVLK